MKIKTQDLTGPALDLAVARALYGYDYQQVIPFFNPSINWNQGGPLIEREGVSLTKFPDYWEAQGDGPPYHDDTLHTGPTPLIAAMRCYVASKLGDEVEIPEELK